MIVKQSVEFGKEIQLYMSTNEITTEDTLDRVNKFLNSVPGTDFEVSYHEIQQVIVDFVNLVPNFLIQNFAVIGFSSINIITQIVLFFLLLGSFFPNHQKIIDLIKSLSPFDNFIDDIYINRIISVSKTMIGGTFLIAFTQGIITGIMMWILGVEYVVFWTILMTFMAIIPTFGTSLISVPIGLVMMFSGNLIPGLILVLFSILIVSNIDNVLRAKMVSKDSKLHPLLVILSILGGIRFFGLFGFLFGPIIILVLTTTIEVYHKYYKT